MKPYTSFMRKAKLPLLFLWLCLVAVGGLKASTTLVYPKNKQNVSDTTVTFIWNLVPGSLSYTLQVSTSPTFTSQIVNLSGIVTNTASVSTLTFGSYYYWRVLDSSANNIIGISAVDTLAYFNPTNFTGLSFWLKADGTLVKDAGNNVSAWISPVNNDTVAQSSPAKRPVWVANGICGRPVVTFNGSQDLIGPTNLQNIGSNSKTFFVLGKANGQPSTYYAKSYYGGPPNRYALFYAPGITALLEDANSATHNVSNNRGIGNYEIMATTIDRSNASMQLFANDTLLGTSAGIPNASVNVANPYRFLVGGYNYINDVGETFILNGLIGEMVFYDNAQSDSIRRMVQQYLFDKYSPPVNLGTNIISNNFCADTLKTSGCYIYYVWNTGVSGANASSLVVTLPGTYKVTATDIFGRTSVDSIKVVQPNPNFTGANNKICLGTTVRWNTGLSPSTYQFHWSNNSTNNYLDINTAGIYSVTVTGPNGCAYTATPVTFVIDSFKYQTSLGTNDTFCTGNLLSLAVGAQYVANYHWSTGINDTLASTSVNAPGLYKVTMTDYYGCTATDSLHIIIKGIGPVANAKSDTVCNNAPVQFTDLSTIQAGNTINSWLWKFGDGASSTLQNPKHLYTAAGVYNDTLISGASTGCLSTPVIKQVLVRQTAQALFTDSLACTGDSTRFFDRSTPANGDSLTNWFWNFGARTSNLKNPHYKFTTIGTDTVKLIVFTLQGCNDTFTKAVNVISNAATPMSFSLLQPINTTNLTNPFDIFTWQPSPNAVRYVLQIYSNTGLSNLVYSHEVYSPRDSVYSIPNSTLNYYWRVVAYNICGDSISSNVFTFTRFIPSLVGNPSFWVMADGALVKNSSNLVSQWTDISGNTNNVYQTNLNASPRWIASIPILNNKPAIRFDGTNTFLNGGDILNIRTKDRTTFVVGRSQSSTGTYFAKSFFGAAKNRYANYWANGILNYTINDNIGNNNVPLHDQFGNYELISTFTNRANGLMGLEQNTSDSASIGGLQGPSADIDSAFDFLLGAYNSGSFSATITYLLNGDIAEIIFFDTLLSPSDNNDVKRYLYIKYGGGPVYLGPDITINYGFCDVITLNASNRYVKYRWSTGDSSQTISVRNAGSYAVTVTDIFDQVYSDTINIIKPTIPLPPVDTFCLGGSTTWSVGLGRSGYRYKFNNPNNINVVDSNLVITTPGKYWVTITDTISPLYGGPCSISDTINVLVDSFRVLASLGPDTTLCAGQYIGLRAKASSAANYLWSNGTTDSTLKVSATGTYTLTVTSVNGCTSFDTLHVTTRGKVANINFSVSPVNCFTDSVHINNNTTIDTPFQVISYLWQLGDNTTDTVLSPTHYYNTIGRYNITLTVTADSGCVNTLTQTILVNPLPIPAFSHSVGCANSVVTFKDLSTATLADPVHSWQWDFGDGTGFSTDRNPQYTYAAPGKYVVTLTAFTLSGCPKSVSDTVEVFPAFNVAFSASNLCIGQQVAFHDASPGFSNVQWLWQFPDNTFATDSNPIKVFNPTGKYNIVLTATNAIGCITTVSDSIEIFGLPTASFNNPDACVQFPYAFADLSTSVVGDSVVGRVWTFGDSTATSIKHKPYHQYADTGSYQVTLQITTLHGCKDAITKPVNLIGKPAASFNYGPNYGGAPININFSNNSTGGSSYQWQFGDGASSTDINPSHLYTSNGSFNPTLVVTNNVGCTDTAKQTIDVIPASLDLAIVYTTISQDTDGRYNMDALIANVGTRTVYYFDIDATLGGGNTLIERVNDTLVTGAQLLYHFASHYFTTVDNSRTYICIETVNPDGEADQNPANNLECTALKNDIRIINPYPNPAQNQMSFGVVMPEKALVTVTMFNELGQKMGTVFDAVADKGLNKWDINTGTLGNGAYLLRLKYKDTYQTIKFVIAR